MQGTRKDKVSAEMLPVTVHSREALPELCVTQILRSRSSA